MDRDGFWLHHQNILSHHPFKTLRPPDIAVFKDGNARVSFASGYDILLQADIGCCIHFRGCPCSVQQIVHADRRGLRTSIAIVDIVAGLCGPKIECRIALAKPDIGLLASILSSLRAKIADAVEIVRVILSADASTRESSPSAIGRAPGIELAKQCIGLKPELALESGIACIDLLSRRALFWRAKAKQLIIAGECLLALLCIWGKLIIPLLVKALQIVITALKRFISRLLRALQRLARR